MANAKFAVGTRAFAIGCILSFFTPISFGATVIQPDIRVGVTYVDNGGFTGTQDFSSTGGEIDALFRIATVSERGKIVLIPRVRVTRYSDDRVTEAEEQRLQLDWLRLFRTASSTMRLGFDRKDLLSSELRDFDLDLDGEIDIGEEGSGIVDVETNRTRLYFKEEFKKSVTERSQLIVDLDYVDLSFDESAGTSRVDFRAGKLQAGWSWQTGEKSEIEVLGNARRYESADNLVIDSLGGEIAYQYQRSPTTSFYAAAGYVQSEGERNSVDLGSEGSLTYRIGAEKKLELMRYRIGLWRDIRPTTGGTVQEQVGLSVLVERHLSQKLIVSAGLNAFTSEILGGSGSVEDRDGLSGKLRLAWRMRRQWFVELTASYSQQDFDNMAVTGGNSEKRSKIFLYVRYRGLDRAPVRSTVP